MRKAIVAIALASGVAVGTVAPLAPVSAQDQAGSDHHLIPRYDGASIRRYRAPSLAQIVIPKGPIATENGTANRQVIEGDVSHTDYVIRPATAPLQIERHYTHVLQDAGFQTVYACVGNSCGKQMGSLVLNSGKVAPIGFADGLFNDHIRVYVARKDQTWVVLHIAEGPDRSLVYQAVVEGSDAGAD